MDLSINSGIEQILYNAFFAQKSPEKRYQLVYRIGGEGEFAVWNGSSWSILRDDVFTSILLSRLELCLSHGISYLPKLATRVAEKLELDDEEDDVYSIVKGAWVVEFGSAAYLCKICDII